MRRRWKITLYAVLGVIAALLLAGIITVYVLLQPDRFTAMLQTQARSAGLDLNLSQPASPTLFPRPALELKGITLSAQGGSMPIMLAARGRLVLPWRTLFGGPTALSQLEIDAPRLDLKALQSWLTSLPASPGGQAPALPRIDAGVVIRNGSLVRGNDLLLDRLDVQTGPLKSGRVFSLGVNAVDASQHQVQLRLLTTPKRADGMLRLDDITLHVAHGSATTLDLRGAASWRGEAHATASLTGSLDQADAGRYAARLQMTPATGALPLLLSVKLDGPGNHANLQLPPLQLVDWWAQLNRPVDPQLTMPPGTGHLDAASIDLGSVGVEGLTIDITPSAPAAAASAAVPASAATATTPATAARNSGKTKPP